MSGSMRYVIVDLEATCWDDSRSRDQMEIIEIGAVRLDSNLSVVDEFASFVRPVVEAALSKFCMELTAISQDDVDGADLFPVVFTRFRQWIGDGPYRLCSWGFYDVGQFRQDCGRHGVEFPSAFEDDHVNIKKEYAAWKGVRPCGMARALRQLDLPLEGTHHRGIDDARNIARIAQLALPARLDLGSANLLEN